ncbi:MAG TPA: hypothetical protein VMV32_06420 [Ignavibacteriaceae bacterium]|nr:hypothetical protein [Ignavibacteriaceae bacterium]
MTNLEKRYVEKLKELIIVLKQQLDIMADNKNTDVIKYIGLLNLNNELQQEIASLEQQIEQEKDKIFSRELTIEEIEEIKNSKYNWDEIFYESKLKEELIKWDKWCTGMSSGDLIDEYLKQRNNG